eukprot:3508589-Prymnesium_polylepis.1
MYTVGYTADQTDGVYLDPSLMHSNPMGVTRSLARLYYSRLLQGWTQARANEEISQLVQLPDDWRGARPFTGEFNLKKLRVAWLINGIYFAFVLLLVFVGMITLADKVSYSDVIYTMAVNFVVGPACDAVQGIFIGLAIFKTHKVLSRRVGRRRLKQASKTAAAASSITQFMLKEVKRKAEEREDAKQVERCGIKAMLQDESFSKSRAC